MKRKPLERFPTTITPRGDSLAEYGAALAYDLRHVDPQTSNRWHMMDLTAAMLALLDTGKINPTDVAIFRAAIGEAQRRFGY